MKPRDKTESEKERVRLGWGRGGGGDETRGGSAGKQDREVEKGGGNKTENVTDRWTGERGTRQRM